MSGKQALPNRSRTTSKSSSGRSSEGSPPPKPPPAAPATYSNEELDYLEQQNEKHVTQKHLIYALDHVVQVLNKARLPYGVMGGMSMIFLGYRGRTTSDVDVAVQVKAKDLLAAFATDKRVYIPRASAVSGSGVARMFVLTGPSYGQTEAIPPLAVEVDLLLNGECQVPYLPGRHKIGVFSVLLG
ncbi:hypothetical protein N658DRAFT_221306 [Parathielavia hyrcaniae]|uniref:Nucleotidyltransferase family protein n=1 Tax=Parathielavia hyrcaniae TaxID=113614 RepID=A0AAN6PUU3_9PEZI|nr:hypothetical protein N658DRAFT_221306 [Parathielavia hyrcaniae]